MLLPYVLTTLFSLLSSATSLPTQPTASAAQVPSSCGYVLFLRNENVHVSLSAHNNCQHIYFNATSRTYTEAYAYHLHTGCACKFFGSATLCRDDGDAPVFLGPTHGDVGKVLEFEDLKPKWYRCAVEKALWML